MTPPELPEPPLRVLARFTSWDGQQCVEWFRHHPERGGSIWQRDGSSRFYDTKCLTVIDHPMNDSAAVAIINEATR